jgi:hypothetical protein
LSFPVPYNALETGQRGFYNFLITVWIQKWQRCRNVREGSGTLGRQRFAFSGKRRPQGLKPASSMTLDAALKAPLFHGCARISQNGEAALPRLSVVVQFGLRVGPVKREILRYA